ncbi:glycosyl hydrolase [Rhexocercosporidium sp. MPI-PUGE-AT-0058]|nr:glycosyl hydrolase [Rhexocercosporidium sp. MPI-PUGE-AT-0058]
MAFNRFRPTSHFIPPHSWSNDPCGAVYIPETEEYRICYQWNPGTTQGGNSAWGMARSKDLITWEDCSPALRNGSTYDRLGVFSGSIVSRIVDGRRVLFLFYTSVSAVPIHWSMPYLDGCESQSVAFSTDFGNSWQRYKNNPLITMPPKLEKTTGWRDPFVSKWEPMSKLLGMDSATDYMMIASGERGSGPQLLLYQSNNLLDWQSMGTLLDMEANAKITPTSEMNFGMNFECASFFTIGERHYIIVGVEEDKSSKKHDCHSLLWLSGTLSLENGQPRFTIMSHGVLDNGIAYAAHIFRDAEGRILQLGWANEAANRQVVEKQGWAGCLTHPKELYEISVPVSQVEGDMDRWNVNESSKTMTTLGMRLAPQVANLRGHASSLSLESLPTLRSANYEIEATFSQLSGHERFVFNVRESPSSAEVTKIIFDMGNNQITVHRSRSSLENLGENSPETGKFHLLPGEDLKIRIFVDNSILEIFANDRFALTSRVYPSLEASVGASYDFGDFDQTKVEFWCWETLRNAWPTRASGQVPLEEVSSVPIMRDEKHMVTSNELEMVHA